MFAIFRCFRIDHCVVCLAFLINLSCCWHCFTKNALHSEINFLLFLINLLFECELITLKICTGLETECGRYVSIQHQFNVGTGSFA